MAPFWLTTFLLTLFVPQVSACTEAVISCFKSYFNFTPQTVPDFCDYVGNGGEACLIGKNISYTSSNVNKILVQCHILNKHDKVVAHLTWRYLAYCYYNKPGDAIFPQCFKKISEKCNKPSSAECKTACDSQFIAIDSEKEWKAAEDGKNVSIENAAGAVATCTAITAILTFLALY